MLTKEAILEAQDLPVQKVDVPEWGGFVFIRTLTGEERDRFEGSIQTGRGKKRTASFENLRARVTVMVVCDEEGNRVFSNGDVAKLGEKSGAALDRIFSAAMKLNKYTDDEIEELAGN